MYESNGTALKADLTRIENKLEAFRESVDDRFDQTIELLKSSFRTVSDEIKSLKEDCDSRLRNPFGHAWAFNAPLKRS